MTDFPTQARVVIIGGGVVGCSVACHLGKSCSAHSSRTPSPGAWTASPSVSSAISDRKMSIISSRSWSRRWPACRCWPRRGVTPSSKVDRRHGGACLRGADRGWRRSRADALRDARRDSCRTGKAFHHFGHDITCEDHVLEVRPGVAVTTAKSDFIGRDAVLRKREAGLARRMLASRYEIDVAGCRVPAEASLRPMHDPKSERMRG